MDVIGPAHSSVPEPERHITLGEFGHSVGFLLSQLGYAVNRRFHARLDEFSLEPRHFGLMRAIDAKDQPSQQVLAETLHIPASSLVALLDGLEGRGLVTRRLDPKDRRVRLVELTAPGRELLGRVIKVAIGIEMEVCGWMAPGQREALIAELSAVAKRLGLLPGVHPAGEEGEQVDPAAP